MLARVTKAFRCTRDYLMCAGWLERVVIILASLMLTFIPVFFVGWPAFFALPIVAVVTLRLLSIVTANVTGVSFRWLTKDEYDSLTDHYTGQVREGKLLPGNAVDLLQKEAGCLYLDYWFSSYTRDYLAESFAAYAERYGFPTHDTYSLARGPYDDYGNIV